MREEIFIRSCPICGQKFETQNSRKIYCSERCRKIEYVRNRTERRKEQKIVNQINSNFTDHEIMKEKIIDDKLRCNRYDCQLYCESNIFFENNCMGLTDIDEEYIKDCPFYKKKPFTNLL